MVRLPGWLYRKISAAPGITVHRFYSYSIVMGKDGECFHVMRDPSHPGLPFIPHRGDPEEFYRHVANNGLTHVDATLAGH
jgi:hypothetical protein